MLWSISWLPHPAYTGFASCTGHWLAKRCDRGHHHHHHPTSSNIIVVGLGNTRCLWAKYFTNPELRPFGDDFPEINHDPRARSQWGRYYLPRLITIFPQGDPLHLTSAGWLCLQQIIKQTFACVARAFSLTDNTWNATGSNMIVIVKQSKIGELICFIWS